MCGIAGFLGDYQPSLLTAMNAAQVHRGPDGGDIWHHQQAGVGLAHRRLSILDLSASAAQPMVGCGGRYMVIFNGEIYNFKSLYEQLKVDYELNAYSDTSVLIPLYDRYGTDMLQHLNGMFAFAIWDTQAETLFVARDHYGVKPLYYTQTPRGFLFASELKALLQAEDVDKTLNPDAFADYLCYLWSPGAATPLQHVSKLPPGHALQIKRGQGAQVWCWHRSEMSFNYNYNKDKKDLSTLLDTVVQEQCISDVPVGAFLSGGVDSSAVVASMVAQNCAPQQTYCMSFHDSSMAEEGFSDDITFAKDMATHFNVPLQEIRSDASVLDNLPALVQMLEEPLADPAPLYVHQIAEAARADGIKVLMSGTGGDDVFAGYRRHQATMLRQRLGLLAPVAGQLALMGSAFVGGHLQRRLHKLGYMLRGSENDFLRRSFVFSPYAQPNHIFSPEFMNIGKENNENALEQALRASEGHHPLNRQLLMEFAGFLPDLNLLYTDKAAMAASVEVRVPLIDPRLVAFMADVPPAYKINGGVTKWLLKEAVQHRLPAGILQRPKAGFGAPVRQWLCHDRADMVQDILFGSRAATRGLFQTNQLQQFWADVRAQRVDGAYAILSCIMMELWCQAFIDD